MLISKRNKITLFVSSLLINMNITILYLDDDTISRPQYCYKVYRGILNLGLSIENILHYYLFFTFFFITTCSFSFYEDNDTHDCMEIGQRHIIQRRLYILYNLLIQRVTPNLQLSMNIFVKRIIIHYENLCHSVDEQYLARNLVFWN